jgi:hypothetical protein
MNGNGLAAQRLNPTAVRLSGDPLLEKRREVDHPFFLPPSNGKRVLFARRDVGHPPPEVTPVVHPVPVRIIHVCQFAVEVVLVRHRFGDAVDRALLGSRSPHRIKAPSRHTRAIAHSGTPTDAVRNGQAVVARLVVQEADRRRRDRAGLRRIGLRGQPVVRVIAVRGGRGCSALLVGLRTDLLEQVAVGVVEVVDRARFRVRRLRQAAQRIVLEAAVAPILSRGSRSASLFGKFIGLPDSTFASVETSCASRPKRGDWVPLEEFEP